MTPTPPTSPAPALEMNEAALARLGVTRAATEQFDVGAQLHSSPADAVGQAKRTPLADNNS